MSSIKVSFDESAAPVVEESAEPPLLLAATLPAASTTEDEELCPCQKAYEESGNEKKILCLMCIGMQSDNAPLFSFETAPWSLRPQTRIMVRNLQDGRCCSTYPQSVAQIIGLNSKR